MVIKVNNLTILTDPGGFTTGQNEVTGIDVVLITHEHPDHLHIDSLKKVLEHNPGALVITNKSVGALLDKEQIQYQVVSHGQNIKIKDIVIEGFGEKHADIYKTITPVENTGYFINSALFYPGDALTNPGKPVEILALPVVGPWLKASEVIEYGLALMPKKVFPVHDGMVNEFGYVFTRFPAKILGDAGIQWIALELNMETEL
jgi:L-ascorbate metabolism protein UlaG (beta-lactamase superfamily)